MTHVGWKNSMLGIHAAEGTETSNLPVPAGDIMGYSEGSAP